MKGKLSYFKNKYLNNRGKGHHHDHVSSHPSNQDATSSSSSSGDQGGGEGLDIRFTVTIQKKQPPKNHSKEEKDNVNITQESSSSSTSHKQTRMKMSDNHMKKKIQTAAHRNQLKRVYPSFKEESKGHNRGMSLNDMLNQHKKRTTMLKVSGFPSGFQNQDVIGLFEYFTNQPGDFKLKWIDDTTAIIIFRESSMAKRVYLNCIGMKEAKVTPFDGELPKYEPKDTTYDNEEDGDNHNNNHKKVRPETTDVVAKRLIENALGK